MRQRLCFLLLAVLISSSAFAQTAAPVRDPNAITFLQQVVAAMGGRALTPSTGFIATGSVQPLPGTGLTAGTFTFTDQAGEFREMFQFGNVSKVIVSGHGQPAITRGTTTQSLPPFVVFANAPFHVPAVCLMLVLSDPNYSISLAGPSAVNSVPAIKVHVSKDVDETSAVTSPQDWYFTNSGVPLRVEYRSPDATRPERYGVESLDYPSFTVVSQVAVPPTMTWSADGRPLATIVISSVQFNTTISPVAFDAPQGGLQ